ncbi:hypothetical protein BW12_04090 [Bifidobacterium sp. UTCIF-3]|uniref:restriction endonuclease subunit S n=1 Tax=unclassified Bifidobacterium TaxID=2608897 RepID=UPI001DAEF2BD|nr:MULTISPECIES: restriction endonuclease subunit S [unclassified Bifidobacterium]TPF78766.1 hypothetical protein BW09_01935 [Bifidobacterium sp. UTCIF-1]TPF82645.1 hypothetical protein BW12_04090 [Bifidobacterium sp. UTCIF-3]TPF94796.1 hypothetical protein BW14_01000 [Bifidobacterium sp. UTBIF-68]
MERYSKYKDSGVDWIGEIPEGWSVTKVGQMFTSRRETVSDQDYAPLSVTKGGIVPQLENVAKTDNRDNRLLVRKGDFVINSRSDRRGSCGFSQLDGSVTQISLVLNPQRISEIDVRYYSWLFSCERFSDEFYRNGHGIVADLWSTKWSDMKGIYLPKPPADSRKRIVAYLDEKTGAIDAAVADIERSIELLNEYRQSVISEAVTKGLDPNAPMKDSGIDWIGQIPEYWHIEKAKFLVSITNGSDPKTNGNIPVYGSGEGSFKTCGEYKEGPAVLIGRKGATLHIPHYVTGKYWNVDTAFDVKASNDTISLRYYYYLATCFDYKQYMSQTTLPSMTQTAYWNMALPLPDTTDQNHIVDWLDEHLSQINSLIAQKQSLIVRLKEYRSSLISECVTGKVKVPGVKED